MFDSDDARRGDADAEHPAANGGANRGSADGVPWSAEADLPLPEKPVYRDAVCAEIATLVDRLTVTLAPSMDGDGRGAGDEGAGHDEQDAAVLRRLSEMGTLIDRLEAERATLLQQAHESGRLDRDGCPTPASWLRRNTSLTAGQASARGRIAQRLRDVPQVADAFRDGIVGVAHLTQIDRLCRDTGADNVAEIQTPLLVAATRVRDVGEFTKLCTGWRHALAPDALDERDQRNYANRSANLAATFDGAVHARGRWDAEGGAAIMAAINALIVPDGPDTPPDQRRTRDQLVADAFVELARIHLRAGTLPDVAGERPHVTVRVDEATVRGETGAPPAEVDGIGPVGSQTARRLLSDATFTRVVYDSDGQPIDVGTATRQWPTGIRRAITDRDRRCRFAGCTRPPYLCDIDHVDPVEHHGPTRVLNGILLCRFHHRQKKPDGWWPTLHPDHRHLATPDPARPHRSATGAHAAVGAAADRPSEPERHRW